MIKLNINSLIFLAAILYSIPSVSMACGSTGWDHLDQSEGLSISELQDEQIEYLAREIGIERTYLLQVPGAAYLRNIDLNGDGKNEICVSLVTTATCSNGVAICLMLVLEDWRREPLAQFQGHLLVAEKVQREGWANLVGLWASSDGNIKRETLEFQNGSYLAGPSQVIGSWADQRCVTGEFVPRMLCSPELVEALMRGQ